MPITLYKGMYIGGGLIGGASQDANFRTVADALEVLTGNYELVNDLSPQLGGNLDVLNFEIISSVAGGQLILRPDAAGEVAILSTDHTGRHLVHIEESVASDQSDGVFIHVVNNGYNSNQCLVADYQSGDLQPGDVGGAIACRLDVSGAVNADATTELTNYTAVLTNGSLATTHAFRVGPGFTNAIIVAGAAEEQPGYGYEVHTGGTVVADRVGGAGITAAFLEAAATNVQIFDAVSDYILIGSDETFEVIEATLAINGSKDIVGTFEYSSGDGVWTALPLLADGTSGFQQSGQISFNAPGGWVKTAGTAPAAGDISNAYYVRITRTIVGGMTVPTEDHFTTFPDLATGMNIDGAGFMQPRVAADVLAPNNSIYFSTDQAVLVYKDSGGVVRDLY